MCVEKKTMLECPYMEPDEFGDICHAGQDEECLNPFECTAIYDSLGNPLVDEQSGLDEETRGFY